mmetsp:Transcript_30622/g.62516  ORF Transcript_30622/g.62516 Transcript_30622/m.62516 type:complete len:230 (+) Transcript_30622:663-1352(+)
MLLFLHHKIDVPWLHPRLLICHTTERHFLIVLHALFNVNFQHLALIFSLGIVALPSAHIACSLHLLDHSWAKLTNLHNSTLTLTAGALGNFSHNYLPIHSQLHRLPVIQVLQAHLERVVDAWSLARTRSPAPPRPTEEHRKQVLSTTSWTSSFFTHSFETILVVSCALFGITKDLIRRIDFLELVLIAALVGVVRSTELAVCFLDVFLLSVFGDLQRLIQLGCVHITGS